MPAPLKIIIFDGTFKTTPFINRLVKGLVHNAEVYILGFNEELDDKIENVKYVPLGSNQNYVRLAYVSLKYAIQSRKINSVIETVKHICFKNRKKLQQQNLEQVLKSISPDIVHLQWLSNIQLFEKYILNKSYKFILSQRGFHINVRPFVNKENFEYMQCWFPQLDGFHSVSNAIKQVSNCIYTASNKIDHVVYSGYDISKFKSKNEQYKTSKPIKIISVGRDHWIKGYSYAINAMAQLKSADLEFQYTILGVNKDCEELQYLINEHSLEDYITLAPKLSQEKVYEKMCENDVLLLPSLAEGIANVCIEAMLLGVPVVSTNCGGMSELISNNETGFIVPIRSSEAIAEAIKNISLKPEKEMVKIVEKARIKAIDQHNEQKMIADMETLYKTVHASN